MTLTDYYSQSGTAPQLSASTTLDVSSPSGYNCNIVSVSPTSGSTPGWQESNWLPNASVTFQCNPSSKYH
ncbi:hypothetical protein [Vulcanisaeta distributa]|uniref:hypothetical protein n=1 Tax=Vulcanisaeta distributa TaxID=164451 RepID=UPI000A7EE692|nr:hypothetical protein [Vulcanisaeta distributa]